MREGLITGYNAQAMVSPLAGEETGGMLVTAVDVVDSVNDASSLTTMLERAEAETGVRTPLTLADAGYHAGPHLAASERREQVVVMPDRWRRVKNPYHKNRFVYDEASDSYRCPNGERLSYVRPGINKGVPVRLYQPASACLHILSRLRRLHAQHIHTGRQLQIRPHEAAVRRHRQWMETEEAKAGVPGPGAADRAAVRDPQDAAGGLALHLTRAERGRGRVGAAGHGLQPAHTLAAPARSRARRLDARPGPASGILTTMGDRPPA